MSESPTTIAFTTNSTCPSLIPKMPPRRSHTKSRSGCQQCKARHRKCDETGPPCSYCSSRNWDCQYRDLGFQHSHWSDQTQETEQAHKVNILSATETPQKGISQRMKELRLMHHWSLKTCYSFSPGMNDIFQNYAVQLGMQHEFLMDSILAFTCLHLAAERVQSGLDPWPFISDAIQLSERSLPVFRAELTNISSSNFEAVLICSMIVMAYGTVVHAFDLKYDNESKEDLETHFEAFMSMPSLVRGIHSVIDDTNPWLDQSPLKDAIRLYPKEYWTSNPPQGTSTIPPELRKMCDHQSSQRQEIYSRAILMLENSSAREDGMTIAWVVEVGEEFGNLLQKREPIALMIYICWGALLGRSTDIWWRRLAGRNVVKKFSSSVTVGGDEAKTVLDWARSQVDIEK